MTKRANAIEVHEVTKRFGSTLAVDNVSLSVPRGAACGIVGPNGAGKTTLLRLLATLDSPNAGTIRWEGCEIAPTDKAYHARIGYMSDFFGLNDDLYVTEYLTFFGLAYGLNRGEIRQRSDRLLEMCNLSGKRKEKIGGLSRGMRQRLYLVKTLLHDPVLLLLDEPASGLDPLSRIDFRRVLTDLKREGKTILISSHILSELSETCDRLAVMERGRIVVSASVDEVGNGERQPIPYRLEFKGSADAARAALEASQHAREIALEGATFRFEWTGPTDGVGALVKELILREVEVISVGPSQSKLETLFMGLDHHEVS